MPLDKTAIALNIAGRARRDSGGGVLARHKSPSIVPDMLVDIGRHSGPTGGAGPAKSITQIGRDAFRRNLGKRDETPVGTAAPKGTIERFGQNTYNRELRRSPADNTFRRRPQDLGGGESGPTWDEFNTPVPRVIPPFLPERAGGGGAGVPWYTKTESRSINSTTGALDSDVPGRTDKLAINVPAGSYVLPADLVSGIGEGNTKSGLKALNGMFFESGPFGMKTMGMKKGKGPPRAMRPKTPKFADGGGLAQAEIEQPVEDMEIMAGEEQGEESIPIMAAGGEFIIPPDKVAEIGGGDVNIGHDILDLFVQDMRKDLIKTLRKLPGPAKT